MHILTKTLTVYIIVSRLQNNPKFYLNNNPNFSPSSISSSISKISPILPFCNWWAQTTPTHTQQHARSSPLTTQTHMHARATRHVCKHSYAYTQLTHSTVRACSSTALAHVPRMQRVCTVHSACSCTYIQCISLHIAYKSILNILNIF